MLSRDWSSHDDWYGLWLFNGVKKKLDLNAKALIRKSMV
jgi:hypothetical protein